MTREIMWAFLEYPGIEHLRLTERQDGIDADGLVVGLYDGGAFRLRYLLNCDTEWRVRRVHLELVGSNHELELNGDGEGHWVDGKGTALPGLDGCIDIDISSTPFTNTLPIRRLGLQPGQSADLPVLYIYVPPLHIVPVTQRYTCLEVSPEGSSYKFEAPLSEYSVVLPVDANGLVLDYPGLFGRVWTSEHGIFEDDLAG